jgi:hypothetical protein
MIEYKCLLRQIFAISKFGFDWGYKGTLGEDIGWIEKN